MNFSSTIWLVLISLAGFGLILYGVFQEERLDYKKLNVAVGLILILCTLMFISFLVMEAKRLRKYILHILVPWCAGITLIVFGILIAFLARFINFKLFIITSLPLSSLAFFTFNEIYHYIGRMRVSPMYQHRRTSQQRLDDATARRLRTSSRLLNYRPESAARNRQQSMAQPFSISAAAPAPTNKNPPPRIKAATVTPLSTTASAVAAAKISITETSAGRKNTLPPLSSSRSLSPPSRLKTSETESVSIRS